MKIHFPQGFWGRHFVIGVFLFAVMTTVLAGISDDVMEGEPLTITDAQLTHWLHTNGTPAEVTTFKFVTMLGSTIVATTITILVGLYLLRQQQRYWFSTLILSVAGGAILNWVLKASFQRARPSFEDPIMAFHGYSFPSGHTLTATVLYGCLAGILVARRRSRLTQVVIVAVAILLIALVGFSRIFLGAHYLSDVLAAMCEGLAWLSLCFTFMYSLWLRKNTPREFGSSPRRGARK